MFCPTCRHALLHRAAPPLAGSRCSNPDCLALFDVNGTLITEDAGPWPDPEEVANFVANGLRGSIHDQNSGGSWHFQSGTTVYVE